MTSFRDRYGVEVRPVAMDLASPDLAAALAAATRAFNAILGEGLWQELREQGVDVVACCAGAVETPGYLRSGKGRVPGMLDPGTVARRTLDALGKGPRFVPGLVNRRKAPRTPSRP